MEADALVKTAHRVVQALKRNEWNAFRQECTPTITFQEYKVAYHQFYPRGLYDQVFGSGLLFGDDSDGYPMSVLSCSVRVSKPLNKGERELFRNFCKLVSRNDFPSPGVVAGVDEIEVSEDLADEDEARFLSGPAIRGRIASNAEWRIQMELRKGKWKVRSIIVASH